ncbi:hypothetical protein HRbin17_01929 [bacterium HR17]|uniref:Uncharacterized protein n=1 Tax=Candidatus Fervidibacter japonicus TaxID=2035412 RepID=A0A2H5XE05_9BACT|nr:hypothetical protein HRbin17_01929 [bacterium HR17]
MHRFYFGGSGEPPSESLLRECVVRRAHLPMRRCLASFIVEAFRFELLSC